MGLRSKKKKKIRETEEKVRRERREKDKCHIRREGPTPLKEMNLEVNNGRVSEGE
jgi:hypothetical protein